MLLYIIYNIQIIYNKKNSNINDDNKINKNKTIAYIITLCRNK